MNSYIAQSASLIMIASLNDVQAFTTPANKNELIAEDSCAMCLNKGYTYIYDNRSNSVAPISGKEPFYFGTILPGDTPPTGKCCKVHEDTGEYTCNTSKDAKKDVLYETMQYQGYSQGDSICKLIPMFREKIQELFVRAKSADKRDILDAILNRYQGRFKSIYTYDKSSGMACFDVVNEINDYIYEIYQWEDYGSSSNVVGEYSLTEISEVFEAYEKAFGPEMFQEKYSQFVKYFQAVSSNEKRRNVKDMDFIVEQIFADTAWYWASEQFDASLAETKVNSAKQNLALTFQYEGEKTYKIFRDLLIAAYVDDDADKLISVFDSLEVYSYFYDRVEAKDIAKIRFEIVNLTKQDEFLAEEYFYELRDLIGMNNQFIKDKGSPADFNLKKKFNEILTWVFFTNREGVRPVQTFKKLLGDHPDIQLSQNKFESPIARLNFIRQNIDNRQNLQFYLKEFNLYLREVYYTAKLGKEKWDRFNELRNKASVYASEPQNYLMGLDDDILGLLDDKILFALKELEFWNFWVEKFGGTAKIVKMRDQLDQLYFAKELETPNNLSRDYSDVRKLTQLGVSYRAQLERAKVTDDTYAFEVVLSEAEHFTAKIYNAYWIEQGVDTAALRSSLEEVRQRYGVQFTQQFTSRQRTYLQGANTDALVTSYLDTLIYLHDTFKVDKYKKTLQYIYQSVNNFGRLSEIEVDIVAINAIRIDGVLTAEQIEEKIFIKLAQLRWKDYDHDFSRTELLPSDSYTQQNIIDFGFEAAQAKATEMQKEALVQDMSSQKINIDLAYYHILEYVGKKFSLSTTDAPKLTFDYVNSYETEINLLIAREPWNKLKIIDRFYRSDNVLARKEFVFYYNYVLAYGKIQGFRGIERIIMPIEDEIVDHYDDFFGERFGDASKVSKAYYLEQREIIEMYATFYTSNGRLFWETDNDESTMTPEVFYLNIRRMLALTPVILESGESKSDQYFKQLMQRYRATKKFTLDGELLENQKTQSLVIKMMAFSFGLEKEYINIIKMIDNYDNININVMTKIIDYLRSWYDAKLVDQNDVTKDKYFKFFSDLSMFLNEDATPKQMLLAQKIAMGYVNFEVSGEFDLTEVAETVKGAAEYNDMFLLETAYSMTVDMFDNGLKVIQKDLETYYDFSPHLDDSSDQTYYRDPTYTISFPAEIVKFMKKALELSRNFAVKYGHNLANSSFGKSDKSPFSFKIEGICGNEINMAYISHHWDKIKDYIFTGEDSLIDNIPECEDMYGQTDKQTLLKISFQMVQEYTKVYAEEYSKLQKNDNNKSHLVDETTFALYDELLDVVAQTEDCDFDYENQKYYQFVFELLLKSFDQQLEISQAYKQRSLRARKTFNDVIKRMGWKNLVRFIDANAAKLNGQRNIGIPSIQLPMEFDLIHKYSNLQNVNQLFETNHRQIMLDFFDELYALYYPQNNGGPMVGMGMIREDLKASSAQFESNDLALTACPAKTSVCGPRNVYLDDQFTVPVKMSIEFFNAVSDSCHWLVKSECGLPTIEISKLSPSLSNEFGLHYVEYQEDGADVQMDLEFENYPKFVSEPEYVNMQYTYPEGELGELVYDVTEYPQGISFEEKQAISKYHRYVWASVIESEVNRVQQKRNQYNKQLMNFEKLAKEYNHQVDDIENLIESLDNQGWIHQIQTNSGIDIGEESDLFTKRVQDLVDELPDCPLKPEIPNVNIDISLEGAKYVSGFGTLTAGHISIESKDLNTRKSFGVFGQGRDNMKGFTSKPDGMVDGQKICRARYIALNLYPLRRTFVQGDDEVLELTASSENSSSHSMEKPGAPRESNPKNCRDFTPGAQFFVDTIGAASTKVGMFVSMATLAALTLY